MIFELRPFGSRRPYTRIIATSKAEAVRRYLRAFPAVEAVEVA